MPCIKALILASLRFAATLLNSSPHPIHPHARFAHIDETVPGDFKEELSSIPDSSLHAALHEHLPHLYRDGMFEHDSSAVEAVYRTNGPLATKLLAAARYDLIRRQNGNLTTTPTTSTPPPVQTTPAPTLNSNGDIVLTTTNAQGSTFVTTITPVGGVYSSIVLETTTLPDGSRSTYTSFAVVPAPTATGTTGPHLQGGAASVKPASLTLSGLLVLAVAFGTLLM